MPEDSVLLGEAYLQHCSGADLALLAQARPDAGPAERLRARPELVPELIGSPEVARLVFPPPNAEDPVPASPFLVFATAVHLSAVELATASYVEEWLGPRHRAPVFDVGGLREFLSDGFRRFMLAELLASYTRVSSGSIPVSTRRGVRRRRFSELDPVRLAELLTVVPEAEQPGVYRRLGDLALFLTGVFPDHTALHGLSALDETRLLRASGIDPRRALGGDSVPGFGDAHAVTLLERLGRRWYRLAAEHVPPPVPRSIVALQELSTRFADARRILNVVTDRYLFPMRQQFFGRAA